MTFSSLLSIRSHPMRVRGLKQVFLCESANLNKSHPMRVRGLKLHLLMSVVLPFMSHPMRVRGLKPDEKQNPVTLAQVAPHAGAWIETLSKTIVDLIIVSHPMRVRGLKLNNDY